MHSVVDPRSPLHGYQTEHHHHEQQNSDWSQGFTIKWLQGGLNSNITTDFLQPSSIEISQFIMMYKGKATMSTNHCMISTEGGPTSTVINVTIT